LAKHYHQGIFAPEHPEKYAGNVNNIVFRSSWERKFMLWADKHPDVIKWGSEEIIIPYISPVDFRQHRYFTDFVVKVRAKDGSTKNYLIEVKPHAQTIPPVKRKKTNKYINELATYAVNQAKWKAATEFCRTRNAEFLVLTEHHLGIK
jgi:hypothetical protein